VARSSATRAGCGPGARRATRAPRGLTGPGRRCPGARGSGPVGPSGSP
jgi:hypothetical protein